MKRILYLITDLDIGGAEKNLYNLVLKLPQDKFIPKIVSLEGRSILGEKLLQKGIYVSPLYMINKLDFTFLFRLIGILKNFQPHILHTFLFHANFLGRIAGKIVGVPVIISSVRVMEKEKKWHLVLESLTQNWIDMEICVCKAVKEFRHKTLGIPKEKLKVIYNGLDLKKIESTQPCSKEKLGFTKDTFLIGTVARLSRQKGIPYLLFAMKKVVRKLPQARLVIVGQGEKNEEIKNLIIKLHLSPFVKLLGFCENALSIIAGLDIFVLPSLWEGFPNALLEAQALGIPAVATKVGGNGEIIKEGESGILVPPGDSLSLAEAILKLARDKNLRKRMSSMAKDVKKFFTVEKMVRDHISLYEELLKQKGLNN